MQIAIKTLVHDFNNDLTIINGIIALTEKVINRGGTIDEVKKLIARLKNKVEEIKVDLKEMVSSDQEIDLEKYLADNKTNLEEDYDINISYKKNGEFPLNTSKYELNRFLKNVIKNASEAKASQIDIFITSNYFLIKDNGNGIPPSIMDKISNNEQTTTKFGKGHGLGILSMKQFCHQHNLTFQINNSNTSRGTQITIKGCVDTRLAS